MLISQKPKFVNRSICHLSLKQHLADFNSLRKGPLEESDGQMIFDLVGCERSGLIVSIARAYLQQFPDSDYAIRIVANWLRTHYSEEAVSLASDYLQRGEVEEFRSLFNAVAETVPHPPQLLSILEERLEREPSNATWFCLQPMSTPQSADMARLLLRWLELNRSSTSRETISIAFVTLYTQSVEVLNSILLWLEATNGDAIDAWEVLSQFWWGHSDAHKSMHQEFAAATLKWFMEYPEVEKAPWTFTMFLRKTDDPTDCSTATAWFREHKNKRHSEMLLEMILYCSARLKIAVEKDLIEAAMQKLEDDRTHAMLKALVRANPMQEVLSRARQVADEDEGVLETFISATREKEFIEKGLKVVRERRRTPTERKEFNYAYAHAASLIVVLLTADPTNREVEKEAKLWLKLMDRTSKPGIEIQKALDSRAF